MDKICKMTFPIALREKFNLPIEVGCLITRLYLENKHNEFLKKRKEIKSILFNPYNLGISHIGFDEKLNYLLDYYHKKDLIKMADIIWIMEDNVPKFFKTCRSIPKYIYFYLDEQKQYKKKYKRNGGIMENNKKKFYVSQTYNYEKKFLYRQTENYLYHNEF